MQKFRNVRIQYNVWKTIKINLGLNRDNRKMRGGGEGMRVYRSRSREILYIHWIEMIEMTRARIFRCQKSKASVCAIIGSVTNFFLQLQQF